MHCCPKHKRSACASTFPDQALPDTLAHQGIAAHRAPALHPQPRLACCEGAPACIETWSTLKTAACAHTAQAGRRNAPSNGAPKSAQVWQQSRAAACIHKTQCYPKVHINTD